MNTQTRYDEASGQKLYQPKPGEKMAIVGGSNCEPLLVYWTTKEGENVVRLEDYGKMTAQRDELLAALKQVLADVGGYSFMPIDQTLATIRAAIAKAESNQT